MGDDRRLILLARTAGRALAGEGSEEYRSALRQAVTAASRSEGGDDDSQAVARRATDRVVRLGAELGSVVNRSPELRRLAARVERRYPDSLLATVTAAIPQ